MSATSLRSFFTRRSQSILALAFLVIPECENERRAPAGSAPDAGSTDAAQADPRCPPNPYTGHACSAGELGAKCRGFVSCVCSGSDPNQAQSLGTACECRESALGRVYHCEDDCAKACEATRTPADGGVQDAAASSACSVHINDSGAAVGLIGEGCYPRCTKSTGEALDACESFACAQAVLTADPTPPVAAQGQSVNCEACVVLSANNCQFDACPSEAADLAACANDPNTCTQRERALTTCMTSLPTLPMSCQRDPCFPQ